MADRVLAEAHPGATQVATQLAAGVPAGGVGPSLLDPSLAALGQNQRPGADVAAGLRAAVPAAATADGANVRRQTSGATPVGAALEEVGRACRRVADLDALAQVTVEARQPEVAEAGQAASRAGRLDEATAKVVAAVAGEPTMRVAHAVIGPGARAGRGVHTEARWEILVP